MPPQDPPLTSQENPRIRELADELVDLQSRSDYCHDLAWLGTPVYQVPTDLYLMQALLSRAAPSVVVETGVAKGGSVLASASYMSLLRQSRSFRYRLAADGRDPDDWLVVGIDVNPVNFARDVIDDFHFTKNVVLLQGDSATPDTWHRVQKLVGQRTSVAAFLDSDHTEDHVLEELRQVSPLIGPGQFIMVWDSGLGRLTPETHQVRPRRWNAQRHAGTGVSRFLGEDARGAKRFRLDDELLTRHPLSSAQDGLLWRT